MRSKAEQLDGIRCLVNPYQEVVVFDVAFHAALVYAVEFMRLHVWGYGLTLFQIMHNGKQFCNLYWVVCIPFEVLFELCGTLLLFSLQYGFNECLRA